MMGTVLFRCDAGGQVGGGHLIRCLAFATALEKEGFTCSFMCNAQAWEFPALMNAGFARIKQGDLPQHSFDWIVFDHYSLSASDETQFRPYCERIVVIDDLANRVHDCDILIDFGAARTVSDYDGLVPAHCKRCTGLDYLILRSEFFQNQKPSTILDSRKRIFISMGSIDGKALLPDILELLEKYQSKLEIDILATHKTITLKYIKDFIQESKHAINLHIDIQSPIDIMRSCDLAITAGGMTCLELVVLQIPTLAIIVADNQKSSVKYLSENGYVTHVRDQEQLKNLDLKKHLFKPNSRKLETCLTLKIISEMQSYI